MRSPSVFAVCLLVAFPLFAGAVEALDAILARVDQSVVTWSQVVQEHVLRSWAGDGPARTFDPKSVVDELVRRHLLVAEARKMRIEVGPNEVAAEVRSLAGARGDAALFWGEMRRWGVLEQDVRKRCRETILMRRYLALRQEMTYVPEAEVRASHARQGVSFGERSLPETREEIRSLLVRQKFEQELEQWVAKQVAAGRVRRLEPSAGLLPPL